MENLLTYIIQVNVLLSLVFLGYQVLLKGLTFYKLNRLYFLLAGIYAFVFPFLDIKSWFAQKLEIPAGEVLDYLPFMKYSPGPTFALSDLLLWTLGIGAMLFAMKLFIQIISLWRIHQHSKPAQWRDYFFRNVVFPITPFSFFNKIYIHQQQHQELELNDIFKHEYIHVKGQHSVDVLLFELVLISCWYNPFVWLMRRVVRQNLEYLTDQQVLDKGVDRQAYQYSLLHVTKQGASVGISNQFNFKILKKRIMMMNKKRSSKLELSKYAFMLPIFIMAGITFSVSQAEGKIDDVVVNLKNTDVGNLLKNVDQIPQEITPVDTIKDTLQTHGKVRIILGEKVPSALKNATVQIGSTFIQNGDNTLHFRGEPSKQPAVFVDGKELPAGSDLSQLEKLSIKEIAVLNNFNGEEAKRYPNGKLMISTKELVQAKPDHQPSLNSVDSMNSPRIVVKGVAIQRKDTTVRKGEIVAIRVDKPIHEQGVESKFRIRGDNFEKGKEPVFFVDGVETLEINRVDPNNIESIEVLKDANATSIYGAKGNNGIVRITTKGNSGSSSLNQVVVTGRKAVGTSNPIRINRRTIASEDYASFLSKLPEVGSFFLNGKEVNANKLSKTNLKQIKEISYFPDASAKELFGDKAANGAVSIQTN